MAKSNRNPRSLAALLAISSYENCVAALEALVEAHTGAGAALVARYDRNMGAIDFLRHGEHDALVRGVPAVENVTHLSLPEDFAGVFNDCRADLVRARQRVDAYLSAAAGGDSAAELKAAQSAVRTIKARVGMIAGYRDSVLGC